ncbi:MAG: tRNA (guanine(46)-N(7))-methyltransferase TrmB [Rhodobacteraceae bacterium]|nr:tRNA (guanine(46)-N(7))-methyltransferase TrmB [Paracoccaceae bacterium]
MTDTPPPAPEPDAPRPAWRNFYGRRFGHTLRSAQKGYLADDLGDLRPQGVSRDENPARVLIDPQTLFGDVRPLWLEIGFGGGEHMVAMAARYPEVGIVGCEPYINGVAMLLGKIRAAGVGNLAVYPGDARDLLDVLPPGVLAKAFLNYPDPWPKRRHHRRRFVTPDYLGPLARAMAPGAEFRVATDIADYMRQTLEEVPKAGFALLAVGDTPWSDWVQTRYEAKALREGRAPQYATFARA